MHEELSKNNKHIFTERLNEAELTRRLALANARLNSKDTNFKERMSLRLEINAYISALKKLRNK